MKSDQALEIVRAALAHGKTSGCAPLTVAVLDAGGHLVALQREDGASIGRPKVAMGKAEGSLLIGVSSRKLGEMAVERPQFFASLSATFGGSPIPVAGGVLVRDVAGVLVGAVGISGDSSDNDEACAIAGIEAAGLKAV